MSSCLRVNNVKLLWSCQKWLHSLWKRKKNTIETITSRCVFPHEGVFCTWNTSHHFSLSQEHISYVPTQSSKTCEVTCVQDLDQGSDSQHLISLAQFFHRSQKAVMMNTNQSDVLAPVSLQYFCGGLVNSNSWHSWRDWLHRWVFYVASLSIQPGAVGYPLRSFGGGASRMSCKSVIRCVGWLFCNHLFNTWMNPDDAVREPENAELLSGRSWIPVLWLRLLRSAQPQQRVNICFLQEVIFPSTTARCSYSRLFGMSVVVSTLFLFKESQNTFVQQEAALIKLLHNLRQMAWKSISESCGPCHFIPCQNKASISGYPSPRPGTCWLPTPHRFRDAHFTRCKNAFDKRRCAHECASWKSNLKISLCILGLRKLHL